MRTNIEIDEVLIREAQHLSGLKTKRAVVDAALRMFVRVQHQKDVLQLAGKVKWEGDLDAMREGRYEGWDGELGRAILSGATSFEALAGRVTAGEIDPRPVSGRQELYENVVNRHIWVAEEHARIETGAGR